MHLTTDRRGFIKTLTVGTASVMLGSVLTTGCRSAKLRYEIGVTQHCLTLGGRDFPVLAGTFDYWSASVDNWKTIFTYIARIGINTVYSSVPWSIHEKDRGNFDFSGTGKRGDLGDFIDMAAENGLKVILNIGPVFSPLVQGWGIPVRVSDDGSCVLQNSAGAPTVIESDGFWSVAPSLSSEAFQKEYFLYLEELSQYLSEYLYTTSGGPVIALDMQSKISVPGRADLEPFDADYSKSVVSDYEIWLRKRYSDNIVLLNNVYGTGYSKFEDILPPKNFLAESMEQLPLYFDWERFGSWKKREFIEKSALRLENAGVLGMPVLCWRNQADISASCQTDEISRKNFAVLSAGFSRLGNTEQERQDLYGRLCTSSKLPFCDSLISGKYASAVPGSTDVSEWEFSVLYSLMNGVRAFNINRLVDFDRWYGCPLSNSGVMENGLYDRSSRLFRFIRESRLSDFDRLTGIAVLENSALRCIERSKSVIDSTVPVLDGHLFEETVDYGFDYTPEECYVWHAQLGEILNDIGFEWLQAGRMADMSTVGRFKVVILPAMDFVYERDIDALKKFLIGGGKVLYGPGRPYLNGQLQLSKKVAEFFADSVFPAAIHGNHNADEIPDSLVKADDDNSALVYVRNPLEFPDLLNEFETGPSFSRTRKEIKLSEHISGKQRILYAANLSGREIRCDVFFQGSLGFRGLWRAEDKEHALGKISIMMQPRSVSVWEVEE